LLGVDGTWEDQTLLAHYIATPSGERVLLPPAGTPTGDRDFRNIGVFTHGTLYPFASRSSPAWSGLGLTAGARIDAHNVYGNNWSARGGVVYDIDERHYAKLLFGTSFRAPSSTQLYSNLIAPGGYIGNPNLKAERAETLQLALGSSPVSGLTLRADGYLTFIQDRVEIRKPAPNAVQANATPTNSTTITSKGVEVELDFRSKHVDAYANYSLQNSSYPKEDLLSLGQRTVDVRTDAYPTHLLKGGVTWTQRPWFLRFNGEARYVSPRLGNLDNNSLLNPLDHLEERYQLPGYTLFDVGISTVGVEFWRGHESVLFAKVRNLLDTRYAFPGSSGFDIPGFERSFYVSVQQDL
jgi:outer membrane receptor protein involved in Fe transport